MFFLDTNILVYAWDATDLRKQAIARDLIRRAVSGDGVVSGHVLGEFCAVLLHKIRPPTTAKQVFEALDALAEIRLAVAGAGLVRRAVEAHEMYEIHLFDALVIAAAERAGCSRIYSEDFNHGQAYFGVDVMNPFV